MFEKFKKLRDKVMGSIDEDKKAAYKDECVTNNLISFGVLLWAVAESDQRFLPEEKDKIAQVLKLYSNISDKDMPIVIRSIEEAAISSIDLFSFTNDVCKDITRVEKISIIENLFRVACSDNDLNEKEHDVIRKISGLFGLDHEEFIDAKIKVKKEFGMEVN